MQWRAYLEGSEADLELLERHLPPPGALWFARDRVGPYLSGTDLNLQETSEVRAVAIDAARRANAAVRLAADNYQFVVTTHQRAENGAQVGVGAFGSVVVRGAAVYEASLGQYASVAAGTYSRSRHVAEALELLGRTQALDWFVLYKIYELLEADAGGSSHLRVLVSVTNREQSAFTGSANLKSVSGWAARHGVDNGRTLKETMTLEEARLFILGLLRRWPRA